MTLYHLAAYGDKPLENVSVEYGEKWRCKSASNKTTSICYADFRAANCPNLGNSERNGIKKYVFVFEINSRKSDTFPLNIDKFEKV